jgi:hypothetical protein
LKNYQQAATEGGQNIIRFFSSIRVRKRKGIG